MARFTQMNFDNINGIKQGSCYIKYFQISIVVFVFVLFSQNESKAQIQPSFRGYLKNLSAFTLNSTLNDARWDNIVHNRIESNWKITSNLRFQADVRTRLITGYTVQNNTFYGEYLSTDGGYVDLSRNLIDNSNMILNIQSDRMHFSYEINSLEINVGRQRLNWGKSMVWNPNDLFNNYAYLDFDYEERPGTDAIHIQYNWSFASSVELGIKLADRYKKAVYATMLRSNIGTYDVQFIAGLYENEFVFGGGWSGYVGNAGFKGEMSFFNPDNSKKLFLTTSLGSDFMLKNGIFLSAELVYNGGYNQTDETITLTEPPKASNLFIAKTGYFINTSYAISPLVNSSMGIMGSMSESIYVFIPQFSYSVSENIDVLLLSQIATGEHIKNMTDYTNSVFLRIKLSF